MKIDSIKEEITSIIINEFKNTDIQRNMNMEIFKLKMNNQIQNVEQNVDQNNDKIDPKQINTEMIKNLLSYKIINSK